MSTSKLWKIQRDDPFAAAELQWRISLPLSVLILTLFAVPLSHIRPRQGRFAQLLPAIGIYIVYLNLLYIGESWVQKGKISPVVGMWWIHIAMLIFAIWLFFARDSRG
jgi:lipopolysaccharide export system permease protein